MKMKITRYFAMLAAVIGLSSACQELEQVVYNPEDVVAPVLNAVEDINITMDNLSTGSVSFSWVAADFGVPTQISYTLDMSATVNGETKTVNIFKNVSGTKASASYELLNGKLLYDFNFAPNVAGDVNFTLYAGIQAGESFASNVVAAKATAAVAERTYPTVWVIGDYCGWSHATTQFLYDYIGEDDVYSGLVDFGEKAANGFKLTGVAAWDDSCNWGLDGNAPAPEAEASKITLISSGGSSDIKIYSKRFYGFSFSKKTLELSKNYSFDKVGIIGLNGDWDNDIVMEFNAAAQKQVFYADVEVAAATEFKFRMDGAWDLNFGGDMKALTPNGSNIAIEPGNYRVYLNLNNPDAVTCTLDTRMYGQEEGAGSTTPEPEPEPEPDPTLPEGARAINILCENPGWETANLYGWEAATSFNWPGIAYTGVATLGGAEYFYWTLEAANWGKTPGLIFNNGSVQTVDITGVTLDGDKCFRLTAAGADGKLGYEAVECPVIKITYKNEAGWDAVSMYGWGDLGDFGGWPGAPMTKEGDVWVYELPVEHLGKSTSLIFNNAGAGAQTVDLGPFVLTEDLVFDNSNAAIK